jgi:hypothetical protein
MGRCIRVTFHGGGAPNWCQIFADWYDFADYVKQENLKGYVVHIFQWDYV